MSEYSPPNWTEPLPIYNPINFRQTAQTTNGGGGGGSGFLKYPVAQGPQTMKDTLINGSFSVSASEPVNMGGNIVQNAGTPVNPTDLATKAYVDLNAGTQNLQSVLTTGNTTGNFQINHSANYGDIYNGSGANWVVACDPVQFSSSATNDLYLASNATDNFVRMGSYSGSTFTETARIGDLATGEKRAIISGTLKAVCIEDNATTPSKGTSGQFLSCGAGGNLIWASVGGGGGGVSSITAGNNISVNSSTPSAPVVAVRSPLNATLDVGSQSITSTTSAVGITPLAGQDCNVVVSGAGGLHIQQASAGGATNPSCRMTNTNATGSVAMEVYKNKPTAGVAGDVLFTQSIFGKDAGNLKQEYTRITHTIRDNTSLSEDGSMEFLCFNAGSVTTFLQLNGVENEINIYKTLDLNGNAIRTTTGDMAISTQPSTGTGNMNITAKGGMNLNTGLGLSSTTTTGNILLRTNAGSATIEATTGLTNTTTTGNINLTAPSGGIELTAGSTIGIQTNQGAGEPRSILRTGFTNTLSQNLDYYPSYVIKNNGLTTNISLPYIPYQNLTLINEGVNATYSWSDVGDVVGTNPLSFYRASSGLIWVGLLDEIKIYSDFTFTNPPLFVINLASSSGVFVFHEAEGFMFVGGQFAGVSGSPTSQFSLLRFAGAGTSTPTLDPMFSSSGQEGFNGQIYAITNDNENLYVGGLFSTTFPTPFTLSNLCIIGNAFATSGSQTYTDDSNNFATNGVVYAMYSHNNSGTFNIYVGGNFTNVASGFQSISYGAVYSVGWTTTPFTTLGLGNFNSLIIAFSPAVDGNHLLITGAFGFTEDSKLIQYGGYSTLATPFTTPIKPFNITGLGPSGLVRNCINRPNGLTPPVNFFITDNRQVWFGTDINAWEDGGVAFGSGTPTGIIWNGANPYVLAPATTTGVRIGNPTTANATFVLPSENFRTSTGTFAKATLAEYTSQQFVADSTGTLYIPVGTPISTFSN
jgi:hypothetical protein